MEDGLRDRLIGLVSQLLGAEARLPEPFPLDLQLSDLGVGSLKMVTLMLAVEREFDIAIPQGEVTPENFHSLGSMAALVGRLILPLSEH
jgi:acyl carrier protein